MILNILLGFIIPWIITLIIVQERKIIYYIAPFASVVSFIINALGFHFFWNLYPFYLRNLSAVPFNIGLFCLFPCANIQIMRKYNISPYIALSLASLVLTIFELCGKLVDRVVYFNNWNIVTTYFSYFISLLASYIFYKILKNKLLFN